MGPQISDESIGSFDEVRPAGAAVTLSFRHKSFPPSAWGRPLREFVADGPRRSAFATPLLTVDRSAVSHNTTAMFGWLRDAGLQIAPHGKTTMAPALWRRLLEAGAWGITLATAWQAQVGRAAGLTRIMLANAELDPVGLHWISAELDRRDDVEILCWTDRLEGIAAMEGILRSAGARRPVPVIAELGADRGRTGARTVDEALEIARRVHASEMLELAGVGGYEGALAHDRSEAGLERVDAYLQNVAALHRAVSEAGLYRRGRRPDGTEIRPVVTAGGSAYFDRVAAVLGAFVGEADVVLRSGAFQIHDDGFYSTISPMGSLVGHERFRPGMHAWVRVVSRPEPNLALVDGGKRDLPYDEGLPTPQRIVGASVDESERILSRCAITELNDQHGFLRIGGDADDAASLLPIGTVLRLGLSHPCTAFDKWRLIPLVEDADADDPLVVDAVETCF